MSETPRGRERLEPPDISEKGGLRNGRPQVSNERLFMQLLAFGECRDLDAAIAQVREARIDAVVYEDVNDPRGMALLTMNRDPAFFVDVVRPMLNRGPLGELSQKPQFTMFGRTYSLGYEPDLQAALFDRPRSTVLNPIWPWAVWYPLRRNSAFAQLAVEQQRVVLKEHGEIGMRFGAADYVHDIRLACYGLDRDDNDFVIGLIGKALHPLSAVVQAMRNTQHTSLYLDRLGPFLVGRAAWQSNS